MYIANRNGTHMELSGNPCLGCISLFLIVFYYKSIKKSIDF